MAVGGTEPLPPRCRSQDFVVRRLQPSLACRSFGRLNHAVRSVADCGLGGRDRAGCAPPVSCLGEFHLSAQRRSAKLRLAALPKRVRAEAEVPEVCQTCARTSFAESASVCPTEACMISGGSRKLSVC